MCELKYDWMRLYICSGKFYEINIVMLNMEERADIRSVEERIPNVELANLDVS